MANPIPDDTRGIIDPAAMMRLVAFDRYPAGPILEGLIEWFWSVSWDMPEGVTHDQQVLSHPAGNISVGTVDDRGLPLDPAEGRVYGVMGDISYRHLVGQGWTVAARTTVGGLGVFLNGPARAAADSELTFEAGLPGIDGPAAVEQISAPVANAERVDRLRSALETVVASRPEALITEAINVVRVTALAETDRTICRVEQLADAADVSVRSLQRLFDTHVGASPSFVIRRWRIIEAAEAARTATENERDWQGWSTVAAELGYADQAHLTRDFRRHLGVSPSTYVATLRPNARQPIHDLSCSGEH